jgi:glc operon protein GlcG
MKTAIVKCCTVAALALGSSAAFAQVAAYGEPIDVESAKKAAAAAVAESRKSSLLQSVAVTDAAGDLVYFEKMDGAFSASVEIAVGKARSAARFKRPTKVWEDILSAGGNGMRVLGLEGAVPVEGGVPIVAGGKIVGAIGVSGGSTSQDGAVARAGAAAIR